MSDTIPSDDQVDIAALQAQITALQSQMAAIMAAIADIQVQLQVGPPQFAYWAIKDTTD